MKRAFSRALVALLVCAALPLVAKEKLRYLESLDRGVVAVHQSDGKVFVSWRLLASDPAAMFG